MSRSLLRGSCSGRASVSCVPNSPHRYRAGRRGEPRASWCRWVGGCVKPQRGSCFEAIALTHGRFETTVLLGGANPHADRLIEEFRAHGALTFVRNATDVAVLFGATDLAVVMAGGVMWELAAVGVPALVVSATDVQRRLAATVDAYGAHRWVGDVANLSLTQLGPTRSSQSPATRAR